MGSVQFPASHQGNWMTLEINPAGYCNVSRSESSHIRAIRPTAIVKANR